MTGDKQPLMPLFCASQLFSSAYIGGKASGRLAPGLVVPTSTHLQDYVGAIATLPDEDDPAYFGLPANINRSAQRAVSAKVCGAELCRSLWRI